MGRHTDDPDTNSGNMDCGGSGHSYDTHVEDSGQNDSVKDSGHNEANQVVQTPGMEGIICHDAITDDEEAYLCCLAELDFS